MNRRLRRQILKVLRPLLVLIPIAAMMWWLLGGRMLTWTAQLDTSAEPELIFSFLSDPKRLSLWMSDVIQVDPLNELPPGVGSQARIVTQNGQGKRRIIESEIVEFDADRLLKFHLAARWYDATSTFIIERKGDSRRLQQRLQSRYRGVYRFATPFIRGAVQQRLDADFRSLKQLLEEPEPAMTSRSN